MNPSNTESPAPVDEGGASSAKAAAGEPEISCKYRLTGTVQNVGFRHHLMLAAKEHGVTGWAKNECDGSLIVFAHGKKDAVSQFIPSLQGPAGSQVDNMIELMVEEEDDQPAGFEAR